MNSRVINLRSFFVLSLILFSLTFLVMAEIADARRFGGGRSMGSRPKFSSPARKASPMGQNNMQKNATGQPNRGFLGGMGGGLLGGLLAGTLIGSLLSGSGLGGGGFMDILIFGGIAYLLFRVFRRRKENQQTEARGGAYAQNNTDNGNNTNKAGNAHWDHLRTGYSTGSNTGANEDVQEDAPIAENEIALPADVQSEEFLEGARAMFNRLQESWDKRDFKDIKSFVSKEVYDGVLEQAKEDASPSQTDVLQLQASIVGNTARVEGDAIVVRVLFRAMLKESSEANSNNVEEVWYFSRTEKKPSWQLIGIEQF